LKEGLKKMNDVWGGMGDLQVTDRSMIWNSDLVETLELENLIYQAQASIVSAENRKESAARTRARISRTATTRTG